MTNIEVKAREGRFYLQKGDQDMALISLKEAYRSLKKDVSQLKNVSHFEDVGVGLLSLLGLTNIDDIDVQQCIASISYMFISKSIEDDTDVGVFADPYMGGLTSHVDSDVLKSIKRGRYVFRIMLLTDVSEALEHTIIPALNLEGSFSSLTRANAQKVIKAMVYADIKDAASLLTPLATKTPLDEYLKRLERALDQEFMNADSYLDSSYIKSWQERVIRQGREYHKKLLAYIENKVLNDEDIDF